MAQERIIRRKIEWYLKFVGTGEAQTAHALNELIRIPMTLDRIVEYRLLDVLAPFVRCPRNGYLVRRILRAFRRIINRHRQNLYYESFDSVRCEYDCSFSSSSVDSPLVRTPAFCQTLSTSGSDSDMLTSPEGSGIVSPSGVRKRHCSDDSPLDAKLARFVESSPLKPLDASHCWQLSPTLLSKSFAKPGFRLTAVIAASMPVGQVV